MRTWSNQNGLAEDVGKHMRIGIAIRRHGTRARSSVNIIRTSSQQGNRSIGMEQFYVRVVVTIAMLGESGHDHGVAVGQERLSRIPTPLPHVGSLSPGLLHRVKYERVLRPLVPLSRVVHITVMVDVLGISLVTTCDKHTAIGHDALARTPNVRVSRGIYLLERIRSGPFRGVPDRCYRATLSYRARVGRVTQRVAPG